MRTLLEAVHRVSKAILTLVSIWKQIAGTEWSAYYGACTADGQAVALVTFLSFSTVVLTSPNGIIYSQLPPSCSIWLLADHESSLSSFCAESLSCTKLSRDGRVPRFSVHVQTHYSAVSHDSCSSLLLDPKRTTVVSVGYKLLGALAVRFIRANYLHMSALRTLHALRWGYFFVSGSFASLSGITQIDAPYLLC